MRCLSTPYLEGSNKKTDRDGMKKKKKLFELERLLARRMKFCKTKELTFVNDCFQNNCNVDNDLYNQIVLAVNVV